MPTNATYSSYHVLSAIVLRGNETLISSTGVLPSECVMLIVCHILNCFFSASSAFLIEKNVYCNKKDNIRIM